MAFNLSYLITFTMFVLVSIPHCSGMKPSPNTRKLIEDVCSQTIDHNMCQYILVTYLYTPNTDLKGLCQISVTHALEELSNTKMFIEKSASREKDKTTKNLYMICQASYANLVNELVDANLAFAKGDFRSVVYSVEKCDRFIDACENVLGKNIPPLSSRNRESKVLVSMSLVTSHRILGDKF